MIRSQHIFFMLVALGLASIAAAQEVERSESGAAHQSASDALRVLIQPENHIPPDRRYRILERSLPGLREALYEKRNFEAVENRLRSHRNEPLPDRANSTYHFALFELSDTRDDLAVEVQRDVLDEWCEASNAHLPVLVRGMFYIEDAWRIRGSGWAADVPDEAWPAFRDRIDRAEKDLVRAASMDPTDPIPHAELITVAQAKSKPIEEMEQHFQAAISLDPSCYAAWNKKLWYLLPRWHGSHELAREHVIQASAMVEQVPNLHYLTLDYIDILRGEDADLIDWKDQALYEWIQGGFEQWIAQYPDSIYLKQKYALYAYRAEDWQKTGALMDEIGDRYDTSSGWRDLETYNRLRARTYLKLALNQSEERIWELATRALVLAPDDYRAVYEAAYWTLPITKDWATTVVLAEHSIRLKSDYAPALWLLAAGLCNTGRYQDAIDAATKGLEYVRGDDMTQRLETILKQSERNKRRFGATHGLESSGE